MTLSDVPCRSRCMLVLCTREPSSKLRPSRLTYSYRSTPDSKMRRMWRPWHTPCGGDRRHRQDSGGIGRDSTGKLLFGHIQLLLTYMRAISTPFLLLLCYLLFKNHLHIYSWHYQPHPLMLYMHSQSLHSSIHLP